MVVVAHAVFCPGAIQFVIVVYVKQGRVLLEAGLVVRVGRLVGRVVSLDIGQVVTGLHVLLSLSSKISESAEFFQLSRRAERFKSC